jgi:hypothetical protein
MTCAQDAEPGKSGSSTGSALPAPAPADSLILLIAALHEQTAAISRMAQSNEALAQAIVLAMAEEQGMDETPSGTYMDGTPRG